MKPTAFAATLALTLPLLATTSVSALALSTQEFVNKAAVGNMFEIKSGKLATKKAEHEDVKAFGEMTVEDHTDATDDLKDLIKDEEIKVELPKDLDEKHQANLDKLKEVSGAKFDQVYVPMQVLAHEQAVNLFEDYSKSGDNDALKEWAADTVPTLKEHLEDARELNTELSKPAKTAAADDADNAMDDKDADKTMAADDDKSMSEATDKKSMEKVTEETDVDGTDTAAMNEKAEDKKEMTEAADDKAAETDAAEKDMAEKKPTPPSFEYVTQQQATDWTAQALIGKAVVNEGGQTLGEINNVILNEKGKVVAVTIGVGGFLGLGEKDVGVPFEALKFRDEDVMEKKAEAGDDDDVDVTEETADANDDADHDDEVIVLDATKEQLEAAPDFVWLGEKREKRADADAETSTQ